MNLVLLFEDDFVAEGVARLSGRRLQHVASVHRAAAGDELVVGVAGGRIGRGRVLRISSEAVDLEVTLDRDPPPPALVTLVLALPGPKVLNRVIASATSMGIKQIHLINAWRVEKSYWSSPRLSPENLRLQSILGLEQACDTTLPTITLHRLFRPFVEEELRPPPRAFVAHPPARAPLPRAVREPVTLAIGPEGGFIDAEIASLERAGFEAVTMGERILRVETAVAWAVATLQEIAELSC
jgi:RsmE family RNA methyltransferase